MAIPKDWKECRLEDACISKGQYGANAPKQPFDCTLPRYIRITDIDTAGRLKPNDAVSIDHEIARDYIVAEGDILIARSGATVGKSYIHRNIATTCAYAGYLIRFQTHPEKLFPTFLSHYLHTPEYWKWVADTQRAQAQPNINAGEYGSLLIPLPPLPEQKKIAAVLSSVDAAIEKTEAVIAQLQVVKKAMMEQLLTKGMPGRHTRFKQTDLGEIPEEWEVVSLGSVIDGIDAGWSPQCESRPAANGEWGVLKISSVTWGTFDPTENKKLPDHLVPRPNIAVHAGDVLLSRANTPELVGRTVIVEQTYSNLMLSDKLLRLRINRLVAEPRFINLVLGAPLWRELIQDAATGSSGSMKNLSQEKLRALPIPKPATKEQDAIANIISAQDAVVRGEQLALDRLRTLKSALSSSLLSGELRVPTDSVPCPV